MMDFRGEKCNAFSGTSRPVGMTVGPAPYFKEIPVAEVEFPAYQRPASKKHVNAIVRKFDENRMQPIDVSYRDGKYYCYDGQHRLLAYREMNYPMIPAVVHEGLSYKDEARLFAEQDVGVALVPVRDKWNAMDIGNSKEVRLLTRIAGTHGFTIDPKGFADGKTILCVAALMKSAKRLDEWGLDRLFFVLRESFYGSPAGLYREMIDGLTDFIVTYDSDHSKPSPVDYKRLCKVLREYTADQLLKDASGYYNSCSKKMGKCIARVIVNVYNGRLKKGRLDVTPYRF